MNFQNLLSVENSEFYLGVAFRKAKTQSDLARLSLDRKKKKIEKSKEIELLKLDAIKDSLNGSMERILKSFPSIDNLPIFYMELIKCTLDYDSLKKSLGAVNWVIKKNSHIFSIYKEKIKKTQDLTKINQYRREFYGRISSVITQIEENLNYLEGCRKIMKKYPEIKTSIPTVAIFGFPNVGKTTLLFKLTGSKPDIDSYSFTTRSINVAYIKDNEKKIQVLDTPGTLNRFNKMNNIEKQAFLALKYLVETIVYVFDVTEPYPLEEQEKLLEAIKPLDKKILVYFSKSDIVDKEKMDSFLIKDAFKEPESLKKEILKLV